ncbi:MAG: helix-turn-helix transcriptional regulator [Ilumatobacteraceae bacterium]
MEPDDPGTGAVPPIDDDDITSVAALGDPLRRGLYRFVVAQAEPVNTDEAATALGVPRHTAKFHLDKLVADGLLEVEFARPPGRSGPGAGRPAKRFYRSSREVTVSLPPRHYDLAGRLLARAVTAAQRDSVPVDAALAAAAREWGRSLGREARSERAAGGPRESSKLAATTAVLNECGYEPRADATGLTLANCPFHALAQDYTDLVCGMNLELINGVIDGLDDTGLEATLDPAPNRCCVRIVETTSE